MTADWPEVSELEREEGRFSMRVLVYPAKIIEPRYCEEGIHRGRNLIWEVRV